VKQRVWLTHSQYRLEMCDRLPLRSGRYNSFDSRSFKPALSTIVRQRPLEPGVASSSTRSGFASDTSSPPNLAFHA
jgi:hypothetical protein